MMSNTCFIFIFIYFPPSEINIWKVQENIKNSYRLKKYHWRIAHSSFV